MSASSKIAWRSTWVAKLKGFQTAWRGTRAAWRQVPLMLLFPQASSGGTTLIVRRNTLQFSTGFVAITWRSNTTARRYTNTCAILVFKHPEQSKIEPKARVAWWVNHHRQALHPENPELGWTASTAWRSSLCRRAVPLETQKSTQKHMRRLAAVRRSPGGF